MSQTQTSQGTPGPATIEVGQVDTDGLRLWRAKEALRQAELRLTAQSAALATVETRATSVVGWTVTGATGLVAATVVTTLSSPVRFAAAVAVVVLFVAAVQAAMALQPDKWWTFGEPRKVLDSTSTSELVEIEAIAGGGAQAIAGNELRLIKVSSRLRWGLLTATAAPIAGLVGWYAAIRLPWIAAWLP